MRDKRSGRGDGTVRGQARAQRSAQAPALGYGYEAPSPRRQNVAPASGGPSRPRWLVPMAAFLVVGVIGVSVYFWLRHTPSPTTNQGPFPTVLTFAHDPIACPASAIWSPDSRRIARIAACMRSTEDGDGAAPAMHVADRVRGVRRLRKGADEQDVGFGEDLAGEIFETGIADEANVVAGLLAPDCHGLRHDAGEVGVHEPRVHGAGRPFGGEIQDGDAQSTHGCLLAHAMRIQCVAWDRAIGAGAHQPCGGESAGDRRKWAAMSYREHSVRVGQAIVVCFSRACLGRTPVGAP